MNSMTPLVRGLLLGFSIAAVLGPIGILCIQTTLRRGFRVGLATGLGAVTADALYAAVAAFGLIAIMNALISITDWIRFLGGLFLVYLGYSIMRAKAVMHTQREHPGRFGVAYLTTFFLTLTNPTTILSFIGVFAGFGLAPSDTSYAASASLVAGVFLGSTLWWIILSGSVSMLKEKIRSSHLMYMNRAAGILILGFGLVSLAGLL